MITHRAPQLTIGALGRVKYNVCLRDFIQLGSLKQFIGCAKGHGGKKPRLLENGG